MICNHCKQDKAIEAFTNTRGKQCKTCAECREKNKEYKEKNKEALALYQKTYQEKKKNNKEIDVFYSRKANTNDLWQRFDTQADMAKKLGLYTSNISKVIRGELKTTGGYEMKVEKEIYQSTMPDWEKMKEEHNITNQCKGQPSQHRIQHETIDNVIGKKCCQCKQWRPLTEYNYDKYHWDNLRVNCKLCLQETRIANKDKITEYIYMKRFVETYILP